MKPALYPASRCANSRSMEHPRRGVVLVFVVAVLVLMVILVTAFYSTVRSQSLLQANRRFAMQAELGAQSALHQAARHLRAVNNPFVAPNQNVVVGFPADPAAASFSYGDGWNRDLVGNWNEMLALHGVDTATGETVRETAPNTFTAAQLEETQPWPPLLPAVGGLDPAAYRWSWANFWVDDKDRNLRPIDSDAPLIQPVVRNMTNTDDILVWPYFPRGSLEHLMTPGEMEQLTRAWSLGRRWVITPNDVLAMDRAPQFDFPVGRTDMEMFGGDTTQADYNPNFRFKLRAQQVPNPGYPLELAGTDNAASPPLTFSGYVDYRMSATDLDGRLYLPISRWVPEPVAADPNNRLNNSNRRLIIKTLNDQMAIRMNMSAVYNGAHWPAAVVDALAVDGGSGQLDTAHSWGDLWNIAAAADPAMDIASLVPGDTLARNQFLIRKYLIPRSFNPYPPRLAPDAAHGGNVLNRPMTMDSRPALNINTASREVLAANFAAALQDDSVPSTIGSLMADDLAVRILRCRPFFSRIDWEDFLAANLEESHFGMVLANAAKRSYGLSDRQDSGGPKGEFNGTGALTVPGADTMVGGWKRLVWFRNQIAATGAGRLKLKGFNALLSASWKSPCASYYARLAAIVYEEDTLNPGNPQTTTIMWTEGVIPKSATVAIAKDNSWVTGTQVGIYEWNFTTDATLRPAWDTAGTYPYLIPTNGDLPDAWLGMDKTKPVLIAMPIKLRSYLFEIFVRARYIQIVDRVPLVRAVSKMHAVYDTVNKVYWLREELASEKGSLADP